MFTGNCLNVSGMLLDGQAVWFFESLSPPSGVGWL
jgi:hypothetical protein